MFRQPGLPLWVAVVRHWESLEPLIKPEVGTRNSSDMKPGLLGAGGCSCQCLWIQLPFTDENFQCWGSFAGKKKNFKKEQNHPQGSCQLCWRAHLGSAAGEPGQQLFVCSSPGLGFCSSSLQTKCFLSSLWASQEKLSFGLSAYLMVISLFCSNLGLKNIS